MRVSRLLRTNQLRISQLKRLQLRRHLLKKQLNQRLSNQLKAKVLHQLRVRQLQLPKVKVSRQKLLLRSQLQLRSQNLTEPVLSRLNRKILLLSDSKSLLKTINVTLETLSAR